MEVEFNRRGFALIALIAVLLVVGAYVLWPQLQPSNLTDADMASIKATLIPEQKIVASDLEINFDNQSSWQVEGVEECLPLLTEWLDGYPLQSLNVVITDTVDSEMVLGVVQSGQNAPDARVRGRCEEQTPNELSCFMAVEQGEPGPNLDVAATVEVALLVQDYFRPRTQSAWKNQKNGLEQFQPLIHQEGDEWKSNCLHLTR